MKVLVLTTSYPRSADDVAGVFVADAVAGLREAGVEVRVVSPADFRHFGDRLRRRDRAEPAREAVARRGACRCSSPSYARAARRAARDVDVVHAHWIPSALAALATGQAVRAPGVGHGRRARAARAVARAPARAPRARRDRGVVVPRRARRRRSARRTCASIPSGVAIPDEVGEPDDPPHVLFVGRLSEEKGILDFLEATEGLPRVIVGDGPLRDRVPRGGRLRPAGRARRRTTSARRSCACRRGARATAWSRARRWRTAGPSSRRAVGGLVDAVEDGVTGLLVAAGRRGRRCGRPSGGCSTTPSCGARLGAGPARLRRELSPAASCRGHARRARRGHHARSTLEPTAAPCGH